LDSEAQALEGSALEVIALPLLIALARVSTRLSPQLEISAYLDNMQRVQDVSLDGTSLAESAES